MRNFFATAILLTSTIASASIIKPPNTVETAKGIVTVGGAGFDYSVSDRGWFSRGSFENGSMQVEATKSFLLEYETQEGQPRGVSETIMTSLLIDATAKCLELGQAEYPDQVKGYPSTAEKTLSTLILDARGQRTSETTAFARYACQVHIGIKSK